MPPRMRLRPLQPSRFISRRHDACISCRYATAAAAIAPAPSIEQMRTSIPPIARYPPVQPPSHKPPQFRKSQLLRQYVSLLQSTPLILLFQHNNLRSVEWLGIRRELNLALQKVDDAQSAAGLRSGPVAPGIKLQIIQTGILEPAVRVAEYYHPRPLPSPHPTDPVTQSSASIPNTLPKPADPGLTHVLSRAAHDAVQKKKSRHALTPLLTGPIVLLTFPTVSPAHVKAALSILSPKAPSFPAPTRRLNPGYHDPLVQSGIHKLLLLGARIDGKVLDLDGTRWVGGIEGGMEGLRGQLVAMLQGVGAGVTNTLEAAGRSLYITVEGRRGMMEDEEKKVDGRDGEIS